MSSALDRLDQISACLRCIADLMMPEPHLHTVDRGDLASALGFLMDEQRAAREALGAERAKPVESVRSVRIV